jgi:thioredoxin reductase
MLNALGHANGCSAPKRLRSASAANTVGPGAKEEDEPETEQSPQSVADNAVTHIPKLLWERLPELGIFTGSLCRCDRNEGKLRAFRDKFSTQLRTVEKLAKDAMAIAANYDTVIVGGGPAGLSAALVLGRCMRHTLICDDGRYRNAKSDALHCYMGHDGIRPAELLQRARAQLEPYDTISTVRSSVSGIEKEDLGFIVAFTNGEMVRTRTIVVATGVVDELPAVSGIAELFGKSIHVCPYCDGWEHRNAPVAVYGRGDKGTTFAMLLRQWTNDLVLCTDGTPLSSEQKSRLRRRGVEFREEAIDCLVGKNGCLEAIEFKAGGTLARRALFFTTDQHPRSSLLENLGCGYDEKGGLACDGDGKTNIPGVYVAGDVSRDVQLAIIAAAEGARAALAVNKYLLDADLRA